MQAQTGFAQLCQHRGHAFFHLVLQHKQRSKALLVAQGNHAALMHRLLPSRRQFAGDFSDKFGAADGPYAFLPAHTQTGAHTVADPVDALLAADVHTL